jgi:anti-sigma factor RsiW
MTCQKFIEFIGDYLEAELRLAECREFEAHLATCAACIEYVRGYEETIRLGRGASKSRDEPKLDEVPPGLVATILAARWGVSGESAPNPASSNGRPLSRSA